jgi:RNA polymerase sigma factor (TIGR02999 family)
MLRRMTEVSQIIAQIGDGDPSAAEQLLPLVYEELRRLAATRLEGEKPGHTLQATALVHEAFLRLVGDDVESHWNSRGHFFAAAAEAMRRILIESSRRKKSLKAGGDLDRISIHESEFAADGQSDDLLSLDAALQKLEHQSPRKAQVVKLRYFAGLTIPQTAEALEIAQSTAIADWSYAKGWLNLEISRNM